MSLIEVNSDVLCAGGVTRYGTIPGWVSCEYGDALDGDAAMVLEMDRGSPAWSKIARSRVARLLEAPAADTAVPGVIEYIFKKRRFKAEAPTAVIEAVPILHRLSDFRVYLTIGGIPTYYHSIAAMDPVTVIDTYILPTLAAYGITWIARGTVTPTLGRTFTWDNWTCLQLLRELVKDTDYQVRLRRNADTNYLIDLVEVNAGATQPITLVGRNVETLEVTEDGYAQANIVLVQGGTPAGGTARNDVGEYAVKASAVSATQVTTADPDGNTGPIYWTDQDAGLFLEKLQPHKQIYPEDILLGGANQFDSVLIPEDMCYDATQNLIWVAGGDVYCYNADTRAFVARANTAGITPRGILYHSGTNQIFVACAGTNKVGVYNASTKALTTTITVGNAPSYMALATSVDRIYVTNATDNTVSVINPNTNAVTATIAGFSDCFDICYGSGPDRLMVTNRTNGNLYLVNPNTNTISNTLVSAGIQYGVTYRPTGGTVGFFYVTRDTGNTVEVWDPAGPTRTATITGFATPKFCFYDAGQDVVYVANNTTDFAFIDPVGVTLTGSVYVAAALGRLGGRIAAQSLFHYTAPTGRGFLGTFMPATNGLAIRRPITASDATLQKETLASTAPIIVGDFLSFRTSIAGGWRSELQNPAMKASPAAGGYGPIVRVLDRPDLRTERNYALNPWTRDYENQLSSPYVDVERGTNTLPQFIYQGSDSSTWTSFAAVIDGNQLAGSATLSLRGMTPGDVIQPGDYFPTVTLHSGTRAVVDGAGKATVTLFYRTLISGVTDGNACTIERSGQNLLGSAMHVPGQCLVLPHGSGGTISIGRLFPLPYFAGRTTVNCTVEVDIWRYGFFVPSACLSIELRSGATVVASAVDPDSNSYSDKALVTYTISCTFTIPAAGMYSLWVRGLNAGSTFTMYPKRFQVTLGAESNILPPFEIQADHGEAYQAGERALRDLASPVVQYAGQVIEDDPTKPYLLGGRTVLQFPDESRAGTPKVVSMRRLLPPPDFVGAGQKPIIELDSRSPSLVRTLAAAGSV